MTIILAAVAWLLTYLLHSTVLLVGALLLAATGIVRSNAARDTLWKVALIGGLVTATAQLALRLEPAAGLVALWSQPSSALVDIAGIRHLPAPPAPEVEFPAGVDFAAALSAQPPAGEAPVREVRSLVRDLHISWPAMLLNLWFVGALGFGLRLLWTRLALQRSLRARREITSGPLVEMLDALSLSAGVAAPRLSVTERLSGPIAFGREICLPERVLTRLTPAEQRAVLAHELGHVVRRDSAWLMAALAIESLFFIQPLNRCARRRLRAVSEYLCDDWAAERTGGIVLARCLAEVAGWVQGRPVPAVAAGMAGHCSHLVSRVERLLEGCEPVRPTRWIVRAGAGALALGLVAWAVPGASAVGLDDMKVAWSDEGGWSEPGDGVVAAAADWDKDGGGTWGSVREDGRVIVFAQGYTGTLAGRGRFGFRSWGRVIAIPDGYEIRVDGRTVTGDQELCENAVVRIVETDGDGAWALTPVRFGPAGAQAGRDARRDRDVEAAGREVAHAAAELGAASVRLSAQAIEQARAELQRAARLESEAATDAALEGEADAAIDTLLQLWVRDPESVRRAARRIARTYERELRPQFESLGVEVGRELAPQLQRLTDRIGRDLSPEFARLGAELGLSIVSALGESAEYGAGWNDYGTKRKPKDR